MSSTTHTADFQTAAVKATDLNAIEKINVGLETEQDRKQLNIVANAPEIRIQDKTATLPNEVNETTMAIIADGGTTHFRAGTGTFSSSETKGNIKFQSSTGATTHAEIVGSSGNVGIGVASPAYKLDVDGDINIASSSNFKIGGTNAVFSNWTVSGSDVSRSSGNVGIGLSNPSHKLDVSGDINFTGSLLQNGSAFQGSQWTESNSNIYYEANVAIGTSSVTSGARLEVDGTLQLSNGVVHSSVTSLDLPGTVWTQQVKKQASDAQVDDFFGYSVALNSDGTYAISGAYGEDTGGVDAGAAYVFIRSGTTWTEQQKLTADDAQAGDYFGRGVALNSDATYAVVGAYGEDTGGSSAGAAYVFIRSGTTWTQQQKLMAGDAAADDYFGANGISIDSDGDTIAIAARGAVISGGNEAGAVYIFTRSGTTWTQQEKLVAGDAQASDQIGHDVDITSDGNMVIAGAPMEDTGANDAGAVYIFTRSGTTWSQQAKIQTSYNEVSELFGYSVAIDGDGSTAIVGAFATDTGVYDGGAAFVFTRSGTTWTQQQRLTPSDAVTLDYFGSTVDITNDGNKVVVGAPNKDVGAVNDVGAGYVFTRSGTTWTQEQKLMAEYWEEYDYFGKTRISSDGTYAISGAYGEGAGAGAMGEGAFYIFLCPRLPMLKVDVPLQITDGATNTLINTSGITATNLTLSSTGAMTIPVGTTAQRPGDAATGMLRYNTTNTCLEVRKLSGWFPFATATPVTYGGIDYFKGDTFTINGSQAEHVLEIGTGATIKFQLYGGAGGVGAWSGYTDPGGPGGYVSVDIIFSNNTTLYAYVGQGNITSTGVGGSGGGSTDIRTTKASDSSGSVTNSTFVTNFYSGMSSTLAVAGGGGGSHGSTYGGWGQSNSPGSGGPTTADTNSRGTNDGGYTATGASTTSAGQDGGSSVSTPTYTAHGVFGGGGTTGVSRTSWAPLNNGSYSGYGWPNGGSGSSYANGGGGGGYYGGATNWPNGGGGSNFIVATNSTYNITTNTNSVHSTQATGQLVITVL